MRRLLMAVALGSLLMPATIGTSAALRWAFMAVISAEVVSVLSLPSASPATSASTGS